MTLDEAIEFYEFWANAKTNDRMLMEGADG